jgi:sec-independent protein translocase protein TatA
MPDLGAPEILIILVVLVLLFGSAKLPEIARSVARSMRIAKAELRGLRDEPTKSNSGTVTSQHPPAAPSGQAVN